MLLFSNSVLFSIEFPRPLWFFTSVSVSVIASGPSHFHFPFRSCFQFHSSFHSYPSFHFCFRAHFCCRFHSCFHYCTHFYFYLHFYFHFRFRAYLDNFPISICICLMGLLLPAGRPRTRSSRALLEALSDWLFMSRDGVRTIQ